MEEDGKGNGMNELQFRFHPDVANGRNDAHTESDVGGSQRLGGGGLVAHISFPR